MRKENSLIRYIFRPRLLPILYVRQDCMVTKRLYAKQQEATDTAYYYHYKCT